MTMLGDPFTCSFQSNRSKRLSDLLSKFVMSSHDPAHSVNFLISYSLMLPHFTVPCLVKMRLHLALIYLASGSWTPAKDEVSTYKLIQHASTNLNFPV